jgi:hypothetical protein
MDQFDVIRATFRPKRTDDLRLGVASSVGRTTEWQAMWLIGDGPYAGQWAMVPAKDSHRWPMAWAPESDLVSPLDESAAQGAAKGACDA